MCHFMFNDTSLSGEHIDGERFFGSASQCSSTKPGEVESEYRFIHVEDYSDQIGTKDASPGVSRRINVLISSDGSQHLKCLCKKKLHFLRIVISIPWSLHSSCSSQNTTFCLAPPHKRQYLQLPKTIHVDMFFLPAGNKRYCLADQMGMSTRTLQAER